MRSGTAQGRERRPVLDSLGLVGDHVLPGQASLSRPKPGCPPEPAAEIPPCRGLSRRRSAPQFQRRLLYFAAVRAPSKREVKCSKHFSDLGEARGTRTPGPLLANRRHHVQRRPSPQVTVLGRAPGSVQIRACCCTFPLYSPPGTPAVQERCGSPRRVPGFLPASRVVAAPYRWPSRQWPPGLARSPPTHPHMLCLARAPCPRPVHPLEVAAASGVAVTPA
jgi:hypothetical protein